MVTEFIINLSKAYKERYPAHPKLRWFWRDLKKDRRSIVVPVLIVALIVIAIICLVEIQIWQKYETPVTAVATAKPVTVITATSGLPTTKPVDKSFDWNNVKMPFIGIMSLIVGAALLVLLFHLFMTYSWFRLLGGISNHQIWAIVSAFVVFFSFGAGWWCPLLLLVIGATVFTVLGYRAPKKRALALYIRDMQPPRYP